MRVVAVSGSLRQGSDNCKLLETAARELPRGVEFELVHGLADIPHYSKDADVEPAHPAVHRLRGSRRSQRRPRLDPEYSNSVRAHSRTRSTGPRVRSPTSARAGKPVAVVGASTSLSGAVWAQAELAQSASRDRARVIDRALPVPRAQDAFDPSGALDDPEPQITGSPVIELNRAVAVAEAGRTEQGSRSSAASTSTTTSTCTRPAASCGTASAGPSKHAPRISVRSSLPAHSPSVASSPAGSPRCRPPRATAGRRTGAVPSAPARSSSVRSDPRTGRSAR